MFRNAQDNLVQIRQLSQFDSDSGADGLKLVSIFSFSDPT
ncbi:hypothetical protein SZ54_2780 [Rhizobium sp. UR51a]|nr:hypothetical protein SZ54_2780 [Rhizobium sp. UR51a]